MSEDLKELEARLERATAADLPPGEPLDAQTAALREAWVAWTRLLEAADGRGRAAGAVRPRSRRRERGGWQIWMAAAAAASVSVVLATTGLVSPDVARVPLAPPVPSGGVPLALPVPEGIGGTASHPTATAGTVGASGTWAGSLAGRGTVVSAELAWDDTLDNEIALAGRGLTLVRRSWSGVDRPLDAVYQELRRIEKDMTGDAL